MCYSELNGVENIVTDTDQLEKDDEFQNPWELFPESFLCTQGNENLRTVVMGESMSLAEETTCLSCRENLMGFAVACIHCKSYLHENCLVHKALSEYTAGNGVRGKVLVREHSIVHLFFIYLLYVS